MYELGSRLVARTYCMWGFVCLFRLRERDGINKSKSKSESEREECKKKAKRRKKEHGRLQQVFFTQGDARALKGGRSNRHNTHTFVC